MPSQFILSLALFASAAIAVPSFPTTPYNPLLMARDGPDNCDPAVGDQPYIVDIGFYSDKDCNEKVSHLCLYAIKEAVDGGSGHYSCSASNSLPSTTPYWAKVEDSPFQEMQLVFTRDQTCPPNGPGAVFATLIDNANCVEFNLGGQTPGITVFPHGGSGIARADIEKRANAKCSGFTIESQTPSSSQTVQVSSIVDCVNGAEAGCTIEIGSEHTESVSTSYSATAGGGIEGIFEVSATFGQEYTSSSTTSIQEGFSVQQGQKGYLSAYSAATLFKGKFTGCDSGDAEQPGAVLAIKANGFTYAVVNTGA